MVERSGRWPVRHGRAGRLPRLSRVRLSLGWLPGAAAAALVVIGFFSPWMDGTSAFDLRTFSGFDFARLVRNFEITADSAEASGQIRASALAIYLMPAVAINGALLLQISALYGSFRYAAGVALLLAAGYIAAMLFALFLLSAVPVNQFAEIVGLPSWGFGLTLLGALLLGLLGHRAVRGDRPPPTQSD